MSEVWAKVAAGLHRNPKIRMAGRDARDVYTLMLLVNAELKANGELPGYYAAPEYLADTLQCSVEEAAHGLERCETFHLLQVTRGDTPETRGNAAPQVVSIVGWDSEWKVKTSTDRVRKYRERRKRNDGNVSPVSGNAETPRVARVARGEELEERERAPEGNKGNVSEGAPVRDVASQLANTIWQEQEELRQILKSEGIGANTRALGLTDPTKLELVHRISEALVDDGTVDVAAANCRHVLAVLAAEARKKKSLRWLNGGHWKAERYATALSMEPGEVGGDAVRSGHHKPRNIDDEPVHACEKPLVRTGRLPGDLF